MTNKLLLIDGNSVAFRAFYALFRQLEDFKSPDGLHTNAVYAFKNMLDVTLKEQKPTHVLVAFDAGKTTFRTKMYAEYKGGRQKTPSELLEQLPVIKQMLTELGIATYELPNYEADDIIGTMAFKGKQAGFEVSIISGDKDLTQLASSKVTVYITKSGVTSLEAYTPEHMQEVNGVTPTEFIDMKALMGDSSDNYPGVDKVGPKTAAKLIQEFGSVEELYAQIDSMKESKLKQNLLAGKENALLGKKLATILLDAPVTVNLEDTILGEIDQQSLRSFYEKLGFKRFLNELGAPAEQSAVISTNVQAFDPSKNLRLANLTFYLEIAGENYHTDEIVGFALGNEQVQYASRDLSLLTDPALKQLLEDQSVHKNVFDLKKTIVGLHRLGIEFAGCDYDMMLASYLVNNENTTNDLGELAHGLGFQAIKTDLEVYGKGKSYAIPVDDAQFYTHLATKLQAIVGLKADLLSQLKDHEQDDLFDSIELPTARVLARMEINGVKVESSILLNLRNEFALKLDKLASKIYAEAGEQFNLNSPKQLGAILFEKLGLPPVKKTKTGYSTSQDVLEQLRAKSPIIDDILNYRQLAKIQSTYVNGLLSDIATDGLVHTRYLQTLTATGRLSSVDPNLQNIPVRIEEGKQIRKAFVPTFKDGYLFSCDYSQVELRVLAQISGDQQMLHAFKTGYDIHAHTAMRIFHLDSPDQVTPLQRRHAKAVNFGIVYGISDYGLSQNLGISRAQAQAFIDSYFEQYPQIREYMDRAIKFAREHGYVETIEHRRRYLPDIHSKNRNIRNFAERTAINSPIQGSAADLMKIAMINMQRKLDQLKLKTKMVLQVHDELIFDVPADELEVIKQVVPEVMQNAEKLDVPLIADSNWGHDWYDAK